MANSRQYTDEELIQRVWDVEEIKKLIHKRVIYIANEMRKEELNDLWVQNPEHKKTASFGRNTGYYTGMDAIHDYYVVHHQKEREKQLKKLHAANPAIADIPQNLHIGCQDLWNWLETERQQRVFGILLRRKQKRSRMAQAEHCGCLKKLRLIL